MNNSKILRHPNGIIFSLNQLDIPVLKSSLINLKYILNNANENNVSNYFTKDKNLTLLELKQLYENELNERGEKLIYD